MEARERQTGYADRGRSRAPNVPGGCAYLLLTFGGDEGGAGPPAPDSAPAATRSR